MTFTFKLERLDGSPAEPATMERRKQASIRSRMFACGTLAPRLAV
jgi:hypothetical protein